MNGRRLDETLLAIAAAYGRGMTIEAAFAERVPRGATEGMTLRDVADAAGAAEWIRWAIARVPGYWPEVFALALELVAEHLGISVDDRRRAA